MTTNTFNDIFKFMHRVMNLEIDESDYDDETYNAMEEDAIYENNKREYQ